jgi:hypothetical protein
MNYREAIQCQTSKLQKVYDLATLLRDQLEDPERIVWEDVRERIRPLLASLDTMRTLLRGPVAELTVFFSDPLSSWTELVKPDKDASLSAWRTPDVSLVALSIPGSSSTPVLASATGANLLLSPFLKFLSDEKKVFYFWQEGRVHINGQLFYHVLVNGILDGNEVRSLWNRLLRKNGLLKAFFKESGHYNPVSTEVIVNPFKKF